MPKEKMRICNNCGITFVGTNKKCPICGHEYTDEVFWDVVKGIPFTSPDRDNPNSGIIMDEENHEGVSYYTIKQTIYEQARDILLQMQEYDRQTNPTYRDIPDDVVEFVLKGTQISIYEYIIKYVIDIEQIVAYALYMQYRPDSKIKLPVLKLKLKKEA